jgi:putative flippase GtrA
MQEPVPKSSLFARAHSSMDVLYREIAKFGAVGAIAFVVDIGVFNLMRTGIIGGDHGLAEKPLTAKTISVLVATVVAWLGNRYWTFRHRRRASRKREFILFMVMNIGGLAISLACLSFSHYVLGLTSALDDNIAGNVIGLGLGTLFRFWAYRQFVFTSADVLGDPADDLANTNTNVAKEDVTNEPSAAAGKTVNTVVELRDRPRPSSEASSSQLSFGNTGSAQRGEA